MTLLYVKYNACILQTNFTGIFTTSNLVTPLPIFTTKPTTLVTRGFCLVLLKLQRSFRLIGHFIRPRVQRRGTRLLPFRLPTRLNGLHRSLNNKKRGMGTQMPHFRMLRRRLQISSSPVLRTTTHFGRHARNVTFQITRILLLRR